MTPPFAAYIQGLGLTQSEAAKFLGARPDTISSWCVGRRTPAPGAIAALHGLAARQVMIAGSLCAAYAEAVQAANGAPPEYVAMPDLDDAGAAEMDMPSAGAYRAIIRRLWEMLPVGTDLRLVDAGGKAVAAARRLREFAGLK